MIRIPKNRRSTHPGEMLKEEFLVPMGITQQALADAIKVPFQRVNEVVAGKRGLTPSTALRLAKFFGMSPDFWLNLQWSMTCKLPKRKNRTSFEPIVVSDHCRSNRQVV